MWVVLIVFTPFDNRFLSNKNENEKDFNPTNISKELLGKTTAKFQVTFNYIGLTITSNQIKPTRKKHITKETHMNCSNEFIEMLKVDLDNFSTEEVIENFSNPKKMTLLKEINIFIKNNDLTADSGGLIKKRNHRFCIKHSHFLNTRVLSFSNTIYVR